MEQGSSCGFAGFRESTLFQSLEIRITKTTTAANKPGIPKKKNNTIPTICSNVNDNVCPIVVFSRGITMKISAYIHHDMYTSGNIAINFLHPKYYRLLGLRCILLDV